MRITIELPPDVERRVAGLPDLGQRVADFLRGQAAQIAAQAGAANPRLRALDALQARLALDEGKADAVGGGGAGCAALTGDDSSRHQLSHSCAASGHG